MTLQLRGLVRPIWRINQKLLEAEDPEKQEPEGLSAWRCEQWLVWFTLLLSSSGWEFAISHLLLPLLWLAFSFWWPFWVGSDGISVEFAFAFSLMAHWAFLCISLLAFWIIENCLVILVAYLWSGLFGSLRIRVMEQIRNTNVLFSHKEEGSYVSFAPKQIQTEMLILIETSQTRTDITSVGLRFHMGA